MRRLFNLAWLALLAGMALAYPLLPERVGDPGKEASRAVFTTVALFLALIALLCSHHFILWMGRNAPGQLNLPHKRHWFAPERFEDSLQRMATHMSRLGLLVIAFTAALYAWPIAKLHWGLPTGWAAAGGLVAAALLLGWGWAQYRMFPAPPPPARSEPSRQPRRPDKPRAHGQP